MPDTETHELDVDFEVVAVVGGVRGDMEVPVNPRLPNVVSRRGHKLKIIATIRDVPDPTGTTEITMNARVSVLNNAVMGDKGDLSRPFQNWGDAVPDVTMTFEPQDALPYRMEIVIPRTEHDDHLGQGPDYEATVTITSNTVSLATDATVSGADAAATDSSVADDTDDTDSAPEPRSGGFFIIPFTSR